MKSESFDLFPFLKSRAEQALMPNRGPGLRYTTKDRKCTPETGLSSTKKGTKVALLSLAERTIGWRRKKLEISSGCIVNTLAVYSSTG